ncbi:pyruvate phosphate dikinase [Firmicutes bacterium CAG:103]|nr:pyruvate phosphate dikinase [Firmicutes bacterium CAG:103]
MSKKYLYYFSEGSQAFGGDKTAMRNILGGKGSGLAEMTAAGMPVPQGFTITTEACTGLHDHDRGLHAVLRGRPPDQCGDPGGHFRAR